MTDESKVPLEMRVLLSSVIELLKLSFQVLHELQKIYRSLKYPVLVRRSCTLGRVIVSIPISENSKLVNDEIVSGIGNGCDQESLWVVGIGFNSRDHQGRILGGLPSTN